MKWFYAEIASVDRQCKLKGGAQSLILHRPHPPTVRLDDRAADR